MDKNVFSPITATRVFFFSFDPEGLSRRSNQVLCSVRPAQEAELGKQVRCEELLSGTLFADAHHTQPALVMERGSMPRERQQAWR